MTEAKTTTVRVDDEAQLCVEAIGDRDDTALLLIGAATWSMDWWDDELCRRLADRGRLVVRYDHRDTGRSTSYPPGSPGYGTTDQVTDVVAVLDAFGIDRAHVVGLSMGGGIAQRLALEHRDRLATLTLISAIVEGERPCAGPGTFDEPRLRALAGRVFDRTTGMAASMTNHFMLDHGAPADPRLGRLAGLPTLVLHGTADPLFPAPHGQALADAIPGARLIELDDVGHQLPPPHTWNTVVDALIEHTGQP